MTSCSSSWKTPSTQVASRNPTVFSKHLECRTKPCVFPQTENGFNDQNHPDMTLPEGVPAKRSSRLFPAAKPRATRRTSIASTSPRSCLCHYPCCVDIDVIKVFAHLAQGHWRVHSHDLKPSQCFFVCFSHSRWAQTFAIDCPAILILVPFR